MKYRSWWYSGIAAVLCICTAACSKEKQDTGPSEFTGVVGNVFTRAGFSAEGNKLKGEWDVNDEIIIASSGAAGSFLAFSGGESSVFVPVGGTSSLKAPYTAWYPSWAAQGVLPSVQQYSAAGPCEVPMTAWSSNKLLEFSPVCGLLEFRLATALEGVMVRSLEIRADRPLSGAFSLDSYGNAEVLKGAGLTLDCGSGVAVGTDPVTFWASVPPGDYSSVEIILNADDGRTQTFSLKNGKSVKVLRGRITSCPIELGALTGDEPAPAASLPCGQDFNIALKSLANPGLPANEFEPSVRDSSIVGIRFVLGDKNASGVKLGASDVPVYASFDSASGQMTVSTAASVLRASSDCSGLFRYMAALEQVNIEDVVTDSVVTMSHMFSHCHNLKTVDLSRMHSPVLCDMDNAFSDCWALESIDFTGFDTGKVTTFRSLFNRCYSVKKLDLGSFRTEKCRTMGYMFYHCNSLQELTVTSFDLREVATLSYCFCELPSLSVMRTGENFYRASGSTPEYFFGKNSSAMGVRTGSLSGGVTIYTDQTSANWLAKTNLRWINSGYKNMTPVPVKFIDKDSGEPLTVTWANN